MTPSEDVELETDDLHLWYATRSSEMRQSSVNSELNEHKSGNGTTDAKSSSDTKFDELESENGAKDAIFSENSNESGQISSMHSPSANVLQIEGKTGRNEAVLAPKLIINNLEGETGQIEAVHAEKCSEAAKAQHLHDSAVTTIRFKGEKDPIEVANSVPKMVWTDFCHKIALESVNLVLKATFQTNFCHKTQKISEFGSENGISDQIQQKFTQKREFGPENRMSGPQSRVSGTNPENDNSGLESQNSTKFGSENPISDPKTQKFTTNYFSRAKRQTLRTKSKPAFRLCAQRFPDLENQVLRTRRPPAGVFGPKTSGPKSPPEVPERGVPTKAGCAWESLRECSRDQNFSPSGPMVRMPLSNSEP